MESFTPLSRRIIALGLLVLAILAVLRWIVAPLIAADQAALDDLSNVRRALTRVQAQAYGPEAPDIMSFPMEAALWAKDRKTANQALAGRLAALAASTNVQIQLVPTAAGLASAPSLITMGLSGTGSREDIVRFMNALEAGKQQIRFQRFHLARIDASQVSPMVPTPPPAATPNPVPNPNTGEAAPARPLLSLRLDAEVMVLWGGIQ